MTIITNAGDDDRLSPERRAVIAGQDLDAQLQQQQVSDGRRDAVRRVRHKFRAVQMEAQKQVSLEVADGETRNFDGVALEFEFEEPEYDESVPNVFAHAIGGKWLECSWWPVRVKGARGGLRPPLGPGAWAAILDEGLYCIRCGWRHESAWPEECKHCYLTAAYRTRMLDHIEKVGHLWQTHGPNREQRRAQRRSVKRSKGGVVLPDFALGG